MNSEVHESSSKLDNYKNKRIRVGKCCSCGGTFPIDEMEVDEYGQFLCYSCSMILNPLYEEDDTYY